MSGLHLRLVPPRMLKIGEAAEYCGRPLKHFRADCPVAPVEFGNGDKRWDVRELDRWLDGLRCGTSDNDDAILARLG